MADDLSIAWTEPALAGLEDGVSYIASHNPQAAVSLRARLLEAVE